MLEFAFPEEEVGRTKDVAKDECLVYLDAAHASARKAGSMLPPGISAARPLLSSPGAGVSAAQTIAAGAHPCLVCRVRTHD